MTRSLVVSALFACACGPTQGSFGRDFVDEYCTVYDACDRSGRPCPVEEEGSNRFEDCDFDADAASACLEAAFTCDDSVPLREVVVVPDACTAVCGSE